MYRTRSYSFHVPKSTTQFFVPEFGSEFIGKMAITIRAAYGLKSAGADFRNHLHDCMEHLGYESCKAGPDVWMRSATRSDGQDYFEYILLYVDN